MLRLVLFLAAVFLLLPACNRQAPTVSTVLTPDGTALAQASTPTSASASASATPSPAITPAPVRPTEVLNLQGVKVRFWHAWTGAARQVVDGWAATFNRENEWGIQVEAFSYPSWDALYQAVEVGFQDQNSPDLATAYLYQALAWDVDSAASQSGRVVDLSPYMQHPDHGLPEEAISQIVPVFYAEQEQPNKRLGLPVLSYAQVLFYNQTWAQELGFDQPPATPEQFQAQACAAAGANRINLNDGSGGWIVSLQPDAMLGWLQAFGAQVTGSHGPVASDAATSPYTFNMPPVQEAFTFLRNLFDRGCAWQSNNLLPAAEFATRRALFITGSVAEIPYLERAFQQAGNTDQWIAIPFPSPVGTPVVPVYGPSLVLLKSNANRQLASWLFLRWLFSGPAATARQVKLAEATGALPIWQPAYEALKTYRQTYPAWGNVVDFIPALARREPRLASWRYVRWAVYDAATQLFRSYFTVDQVPDLARLLDRIAADLHRDPLYDSFLQTATPTP